jgi:hypothetical protein
MINVNNTTHKDSKQSSEVAFNTVEKLCLFSLLANAGVKRFTMGMNENMIQFWRMKLF